MKQNPFSLIDKTILVTGASSGIGRGVAIACARMGANVIITARNLVRLRETLAAMPGEGHTIICADLTDIEQRQHLVEQLPALDGIVHCAGVGSRVPCKNIEQSDIDYVMQPNFMAPVLLQTELLSAKKITKSASIVFIASRAAEMPSIGNAVYSASKGAIISYAKCLALELAPRKVRVNCICPAMVWTDLALTGASREQLEEAEQRYPLKRYGQPEDVAYLAVYMLSDVSTWMTGSCVDITGGGEGIIA
jgi:NAD(P)-dependent dehydrogenase (short-subunit alcohol dehydrogenase family)